MTKKLLFIFLSGFVSSAQQIVEQYELGHILDETSGLALFDNFIWTHNDSGGEAALYALSSKGVVEEKMVLPQHNNYDWEDLATDGTHLYVADVGNNFGTRRNLQILKVILNDGQLQNVEKLEVSYPTQTSFNLDPKTPYDAEGLIWIKDQLLLFSKNRKSLTTELYLCPTSPGKHTLKKIGQLPVGALVTGADYKAEDKLLVLTAYNNRGDQFLFLIPDFDLAPNTNLDIQLYRLPLTKAQVEGVAIIDSKTFWISTELTKKHPAKLIKIELD